MTQSAYEPAEQWPLLPRNQRTATVTPLHRHTMHEVRSHHVTAEQHVKSTRDHKAKEDQHRRGKLTAYERIDLLTDPGTFRELEGRRLGVGGDQATAGDGVITGHAAIHGQPVVLFAQDFTVRGGSFGQAHANKVVRAMELAERIGCPVIGLYDGGGARIHEGATALDACGSLFRQIVRMSGVVPQISVILGPCAGAAAYAPALTDLVFIVKNVGMMYLTGPDVVHKVTGERTDGQTLGGAEVHSEHSGVATFVHEEEQECLEDVRYLVSMLPATCLDPPPWLETDDPADRSIDEVLDIVPSDPKMSYDVRHILNTVIDADTFMEFHASWAPNIVCGLGRLAGHVVGVVANQPLIRAGVLDSAASEKAARFVSWCDAFSIPLLTFVDVPGFMPGTEVERQGVIRHGAKLLHAYCAATVPRVQVILRKAYGGAYIVMDSPSTGNDLSYAWPSNEIAVMGAEAAVEIIHRRELAASDEPEQLRQTLHDTYRRHQMDPYTSAKAGLVHDVIDPLDTRRHLAEAVTLLATKTATPRLRKKANSPL